MYNEYKLCKQCKKEKPLNEFNRKGTDSKCKVCRWFERNTNYKIKSNWDLELYITIIDSLLNKKIDYLNDLQILLDKDLIDICDVCTNYLKIGGSTKLKVKYFCDSCNKEIILTSARFLSYSTHYCSKKCSNDFKKGKNVNKVIGKSKCLYCNTTFNVYTNVPNQKFCCKECNSKYYIANNMNKEKTICSNCGKTILKTRKQIKEYKNVFCSLDCELDYKYKESHELKECEICGKSFETTLSSRQRFCSTKCQSIWQSETFVGEKSPTYNHKYSIEDRTYICEWCGKKQIIGIYKIKHGRKFCSSECRRQWYANVWSQTEEWKDISRKRAVKILENGLVSNTNSGCQIKINNLLDNLNLRYINEKGFKYYSTDNYLIDYNLIIEVMGTYWHCDIRKYNEIIYKN
ncbi:TPA: hypothetical protein N2D16_002954, partial [Clostridium botulinum]|nr:hypothetical protein [Clostridium botulinum]